MSTAVIESYSQMVLGVLADVLLKSTVLLTAAFAAAWALRRAPAATRHVVWSAALIGLLALPVLSLALPRFSVAVSLPWAQDAGPAPHAGVLLPPASRVPAPALPVAPARLPGAPITPMVATAAVDEVEAPTVLMASRDVPPASALPAVPPISPHDPQPTPRAASALIGLGLMLLWAAGCALGIAWIVMGWLCLAQLRQTCMRVGDGPVLALLHELAAALGIRRPLKLLQTRHRTIPMTWGVFRPVVLLPFDAATWPAERLRMVLIHEMGHVKRWDCLLQLLAHLARALYWINPLVWLATARLRVEQENACDDVVLAAGADAPDYAEHLLAVTAGLPRHFFASPVALGMARSTKLQRRLETLLDRSQSRRPLCRRGLLAAAFLAFAVVLPVAGVGFHTVRAATTFVEPAVDPDAKPPQQESTDPIKRLTEIQKKIREHYVGPIDEKRLVEEALRGVLKSLKDPYTDYIPAEEYAALERQFKGALTGIGAQLRMVDGRITVLTPLQDSPALKAGLRPGDVIETIDGKPARGLELSEAIKRIVGAPRTVVKLRVVHADGVVEDLSVTRDQVRIRTVEGFRRGGDHQWQFMLDPQHKVGYARVTQFGGNTGRELREALDGLLKDGMRGLVLDLRFCPGGLLNQGIDVCRMFLKDGTILTVKSPGKGDNVFKADGTGYVGDFPLVILLNDQTASSGEIVAGALRDHDRAVLIGTRSFGKGSVQAIVKLDEGGFLKVTTAYHYLPNGRNIQKRPGEKTWGVDPTDGYYIPLSRSQTEALQKDMTQRGLIGLKNDDQPKQPARITSKLIEEQHADPQLAAGLRTMVAKLTGGDFIKVGNDNALLQDHLQRLEEMRQRRESLVQSLNQLDRDITDLQQVVGKEKQKN